MSERFTVLLPDARVWLRVADPEWNDPLDPSYATVSGGRWNPPGAFATLYLIADLATARMQIQRLVEGTPFSADDLDDDAYVLVAATLPRNQACADAASPAGLRALGLPASYPLGTDGERVSHEHCQSVGARVHAANLRGIWYISAASRDGVGRELAWFPATPRSKARPVWREPLPLGSWRDASVWADVGLADQREPATR